jgi:hypothetical protein
MGDTKRRYIEFLEEKHSKEKTMEIINAKVNWNLGWNTGPQLDILVDKIPKDLRYSYKLGMFFGEKEGYVSFFAHNGDEENHKGYDGRVFNIVMEDGTSKSLKGPWSGRSWVTNKLGFNPCMEVSITEDPKEFETGIFCTGAITVTLAEDIIKKFTKAHLVRVEKWEGEFYWEIRNTEDDCEVCKGFKTYVGSSGKEETCRWCDGSGKSREKVK